MLGHRFELITLSYRYNSSTVGIGHGGGSSLGQGRGISTALKKLALTKIKVGFPRGLES